MEAIHTFKFNNENQIPAIGLGTSRIKEEEMVDVIQAAIDVDYRHFDSSELYMNRRALGEALSTAISSNQIKREELFITSKLGIHSNRPEAVKEALMKSLETFKTDYLDLYLIHFPALYSEEAKPFIRQGKDVQEYQQTADHIGVWKEMEKLVDSGLVKSIGLSNFNIKQIDNIVKNCRIMPAVVQVECHAYLQEKALQKYCSSKNIAMTAYAPLGSPGLNMFGITGKDILRDEAVCLIASRHNRSPAQILLRYLVQRNIGVIVKSSNYNRLKENITIFDFQLSCKDMEIISNLDCGQRVFRYPSFKNNPQYPYTE